MGGLLSRERCFELYVIILFEVFPRKIGDGSSCEILPYDSAGVGLEGFFNESGSSACVIL